MATPVSRFAAEPAVVGVRCRQGRAPKGRSRAHRLGLGQSSGHHKRGGVRVLAAGQPGPPLRRFTLRRPRRRRIAALLQRPRFGQDRRPHQQRRGKKQTGPMHQHRALQHNTECQRATETAPLQNFSRSNKLGSFVHSPLLATARCLSVNPSLWSSNAGPLRRSYAQQALRWVRHKLVALAKSRPKLEL
jgi:hypothetical protein